MVDFSVNSDLRRGFMTSLRNFWIEIFQEEQQKAIDMFFEGNEVSVSLPTGYMENILYIKESQWSIASLL